MYPQLLCFEQKNEKYHKFHLKIMIFTAVRNSSILHRRVGNEIDVLLLGSHFLFLYQSVDRLPPCYKSRN